MVHYWKITPDFNGYSITSQLLMVNRVVPSRETAKRLVFQTDGYDRNYKPHRTDYLVNEFIRHYQPGWRNLPMPTWAQVQEYAARQDVYIEYDYSRYCYENHGDKRKRAQFTHVLRMACSNQHAFRYLHKMCLVSKQDIDKFDGRDLEFVAYHQPFDVTYVDWFVKQPFSRMTPYGLRCLIDRGLPLEYVKRYVEMHVDTDWNGWECTNDLISNGKEEMYRAAYAAYEWFCFIEPRQRRIGVKPEWIEGLLYFYPKTKTQYVHNMICVAQNGMIDFNDQWLGTADERAATFAWLDSIIETHKHIHPVEQMRAYCWYKTDKPYIMENRSCPDDHIIIEKPKVIAEWQTAKSRKNKAK